MSKRKVLFAVVAESGDGAPLRFNRAAWLAIWDQLEAETSDGESGCLIVPAHETLRIEVSVAPLSMVPSERIGRA